jgi:O-antigen/teichoic acid export membrane protein
MAVGDDRTMGEAVDAVVAPTDTAPLARQTLAYGLTGLIVPVVGMITLPIFARVFTRSQYGILELATTTGTVGLTLTDVGMMAATLRSFYDYRDHEEPERRNVVLTGFLTTTAAAFALAALMILFRVELSRAIFGRSGLETIVVLTAVGIPALNTWRYVSEVMRIRRQAFYYLAMSIAAATISTTLGVVGVLVLDWRVRGVIIAGLIGSATSAAVGLAVVRGSLAGRFSRAHWRRMLVFGLPLVPSALSAWALALVDRIILARVGSLSQVGQYAIANRLALLVTLGMTAFLFAVTPFLFAVYAEDPERERVARGRMLTYLAFILALGGLVITLFAKELLEIVAPKFDQAYLAVGPLALGTVAYGISSLLVTGISLARKTGRLAVLSVACAALNIGLNFALIPSLGIAGAGLATAAGYGALALTFYWTSQRIYPTPYEPRKVLGMLAAGASLGALGLFPFGSLAIGVPLKLAALAAFVSVTWASGAMGRAEFIELRRFARGMLVPSPRATT